MSSAYVVEASWPLHLRASEGNVSFLNFAIDAVREASLPPGSRRCRSACSSRC